MKTNKYQQHRSHNTHINITPLVDVLLILVAILLLVISPSLKKLTVDLPQTHTPSLATPVPELSTTLHLSYAPNSVLMLDSTQISLDEILLKITPNHRIQLSIDQSIPYSQIAPLLAALSQKKPKTIDLMLRN